MLKKIGISFLIGASVVSLLGCENKDLNKENKNTEIIEDTDSNKESKNTEIIEDADSNKESKNTEIVEDTDSNKDIYLNKLNELEEKLNISLKEKYEGQTKDMNEAASEEFSTWDNMLNEIYSILEKELSEEDMNKLREEEINWINTRDLKSKEAESKYEGGSIAPYMRLTSLIDSTKTRCYELVNKYMK